MAFEHFLLADSVRNHNHAINKDPPLIAWCKKRNASQREARKSDKIKRMHQGWGGQEIQHAMRRATLKKNATCQPCLFLHSEL